MQQEQDCTSIGKNIVFTSSQRLQTRGLIDCEWRRLFLLLSPTVWRILNLTYLVLRLPHSRPVLGRQEESPLLYIRRPEENFF